MSGGGGEAAEVEELLMPMRESRDDRDRNSKHWVKAMTRREQEKECLCASLRCMANRRFGNSSSADETARL